MLYFVNNHFAFLTVFYPNSMKNKLIYDLSPPCHEEKAHLFYLTTSLGLNQLQGLNYLANVLYFQKFYALATKASDQKTSVCD